MRAGDAQDNEYLWDQILDLGARLTRLENLFEGKVSEAVASEDPALVYNGAARDRAILSALAEEIKALKGP